MTSSSDHHTDSHIETVAAQYASVHTLEFEPALEAPFRQYRRESFLNINHSLLLIACVVYLTFIFTDYAVVPREYFPYIAGVRIGLAGLMFTGYYLIKKAKNAWARRNVFNILAGLMLLVSAHICISTYLLPRPYAEIYALGVVQLYIVVPAILKPHSKLSLITMIGMLFMVICALFLSQRPTLQTDSSIINDLLANFPISYTLFLAGLIFLSAYTAYSYEKMLRQNWLDNQLTLIKSNNLAELSEKFKLLSHKDELTQLPNRRSFQQRLDDELKRAHRSAEPFSLVMMDVDNFKAFNDIYGHQAGDDCLRRVAHSLEQSCHRSIDIPTRYGGEEFMVILPNTGSQGAYYLAEQIRNAIMALEIPHTGSDTGIVTASFGITTVYGSRLANVDSLIKTVDEALYVAKSQGRNRTVVSQKDADSAAPTAVSA